MERSVLKKRFKGLLALMLVFMMMFGTGLTVLAAEYTAASLSVGSSVQGGDTITLTSSGSIQLYVGTSQVASGNSVTVPGGSWKVSSKNVTESSGIPTYTINLEALPTGDHNHSYRWIMTHEPTETSDGRFQYRCECGSVKAQQPISFLYAVIQNIIADIEEAPAGGTVTVDNKYLRCLNWEIIEALQARPDVTLVVQFIDQDVQLQYTIPAGQAPTDGADWYGYYYLGTVYGWQW